jgi:hypothetical protein
MAAPTLTSTPAALGLGPTATFTWSQVAGLTYEYQLDSGSWTVVGATNTVTKTVLLGSHTFNLRARVGTGSPTPTTSYSFTVIL